MTPRKAYPQFTSEQIRDVLPPANAREAKARAKADAPAEKPKAKAPKAEKATDPDELTAPQVAKEIGADPKQFRRFLRATGRGIGQGNRYSFQKSELKKPRTEYTKWEKDQEAKRAAREAAKDEKPETDAA